MAVDLTFLRRWQEHLEAKLLSEPLLQYVSIALMLHQVQLEPERKLVPHAAGRNGKVGSGMLINLPEAEPSKDADVPGAQMDVVIYIDILNQDDVALESDIGSGLSAEEIVSITWIILNQYLDKDIGAGNACIDGFEPIKDNEGAYGYRLALKLRMAQDEPSKCAAPIVTFAGGNATITCATGGATIYYTTDESYPGPYTPNQADAENTSTVYSGPFAVASGTVVCATSFIPNSTTTIGSDLWSYIAP